MSIENVYSFGRSSNSWALSASQFALAVINSSLAYRRSIYICQFYCTVVQYLQQKKSEIEYETNKKLPHSGNQISNTELQPNRLEIFILDHRTKKTNKILQRHTPLFLIVIWKKPNSVVLWVHTQTTLFSPLQ